MIAVGILFVNVTKRGIENLKRRKLFSRQYCLFSYNIIHLFAVRLKNHRKTPGIITLFLNIRHYIKSCCCAIFISAQQQLISYPTPAQWTAQILLSESSVFYSCMRSVPTAKTSGSSHRTPSYTADIALADPGKSSYLQYSSYERKYQNRIFHGNAPYRSIRHRQRAERRSPDGSPHR